MALDQLVDLGGQAAAGAAYGVIRGLDPRFVSFYEAPCVAGDGGGVLVGTSGGGVH